MKKLIIFSVFVLTGVIYTRAQSTPGVDQRQRIEQRDAKSELTRTDAANARHNQRRVKRTERRTKSEGEGRPGERARSHQKQNKAINQMRRDKRDAQERPGTK